MRKILETICIAALLAMALMSVDVFTGPHKLPDSVPTHFDASGKATGWGSPQSLLGLPLGALVLYSLMTMVSRRPQAFNFPTKVTQVNRPCLEALAVQMIAWLKTEVVCLFAWIEHFSIDAARSGHGALPSQFMPLTLGAVIATIVAYFMLFRRTSH